jgi:hypothetical protein
VALASVYALLLSAGAAGANNFGSLSNSGPPSNSVNIGDNTTHTARYYLLNQFADAMPWAIDHYNNATVLSVSRLTPDYTCGISSTCSPTSDVQIADGDYGYSGVAGWNSCPGGAIVLGSHPTRSCYGQIVRFNTHSSVTQYIDSLEERQELACHEFGHTLGLRHTTSQTSCMEETVPLPSRYTNTHDRQCVDQYYSGGGICS